MPFPSRPSLPMVTSPPSFLKFTNGSSAAAAGALIYGSSAGVQAILTDKTHLLGLGIDGVVHLGHAYSQVLIARGGMIAFTTAAGPISQTSLIPNTIVIGKPDNLQAFI